MLTLTQLQREHHLPKPFKEWRSVQQPVLGEINGLPRFRGHTIATNGIIVALESEVGNIFFGHLQWFLPDKKEELEKSDLSVVAELKKTDTKLVVLDEFIR